LNGVPVSDTDCHRLHAQHLASQRARMPPTHGRRTICTTASSRRRRTRPRARQQLHAQRRASRRLRPEWPRTGRHPTASTPPTLSTREAPRYPDCASSNHCPRRAPQPLFLFFPPGLPRRVRGTGSESTSGQRPERIINLRQHHCQNESCAPQSDPDSHPLGRSRKVRNRSRASSAARHCMQTAFTVRLILNATPQPRALHTPDCRNRAPDCLLQK